MHLSLSTAEVVDVVNCSRACSAAPAPGADPGSDLGDGSSCECPHLGECFRLRQYVCEFGPSRGQFAAALSTLALNFSLQDEVVAKLQSEGLQDLEELRFFFDSETTWAAGLPSPVLEIRPCSRLPGFAGRGRLSGSTFSKLSRTVPRWLLRILIPFWVTASFAMSKQLFGNATS